MIINGQYTLRIKFERFYTMHLKNVSKYLYLHLSNSCYKKYVYNTMTIELYNSLKCKLSIQINFIWNVTNLTITKNALKSFNYIDK